MLASLLLPLAACCLTIQAAAPATLHSGSSPEYYKYDTDQDAFPKPPETNENEKQHWRDMAERVLGERLAVRPVEGVARNVILFLGDGMSLATVTAARIHLGQLNNRSGEGDQLSFEKFPFTGFSKTYCVDKQVADSASTSTAYLGGVKANYGTLGVTAAVPRGDCAMSMDSKNHVDTILTWAQAAGKATGLVTTTRITHASPAGHYAHSAERDWEDDHDVATEKRSADPATCQDIASQLVHNEPGRNVQVLLGGGRNKFYPVNGVSKLVNGTRRDGRNLVYDWGENKKHRGKAQFVTNRQELLNVDSKRTDYLLGLFQGEHMKYHLEEGSELQPTLAEMTEAAIKILKKEKRGFYLFVEGGKIDMAHHKNWARRAMDETVEFHKAVQMAQSMTDEKDTLIVVTADHAHTMTMAGYPVRGNDILGVAQKSGWDNLAYPTLSYANGPSAEINRTGLRHDIAQDNLQNASYQYPSLVPAVDESHGGDDVAVYARGPWAHLLTGAYEQTLIPHVMGYAARIGPAARRLQMAPNAASNIPTTTLVMMVSAGIALLRLR